VSTLPTAAEPNRHCNLRNLLTYSILTETRKLSPKFTFQTVLAENAKEV